MILLPIFPQNSFEEELLVKDLAGTPYLTHQLLAVKGENVCIYTNSEIVRTLAEHMQIPLKKILLKKSNQLPHLTIPGAKESLEALNHSGQCEQNEPLLIADYRFFPLQKKILANAFKQYQETRADALLSISPTEDNPCQVHQHLLIQDTDILLLNKKELDIRKILNLIGKEKQVIDDNGNINLFRLSRCDISFFDLEVNTCKAKKEKITLTLGTELECQPPPFPKRKKDTGVLPCIYSLTNNPPNKPAQNKSKFLICTEGYLCHIYIKEKFLPKNATLRIFPIYPKQQYQQNVPDRDFDLNITKDNYIGPLHTFTIKQEPIGIIIATLTPTKEETSNLFRTMPTDDFFWRYDPKQQATINLITGEKITGRQNYVDVYSANGAITISTFKNFNILDEVIKQGRATGFNTDNDKQINVSSRLDLLRLKIIHKTKTPKANPFLQNPLGSFSESHHATQFTKNKQDVSLV